MIRSFRSKALERLWWKGDSRRVEARHVEKLRRRLAVLDAAARPEDLDLPGYHFHKLRGAEQRWSVRVDRNWRLTFAWTDQGPDAVDYEDYH